MALRSLRLCRDYNTYKYSLTSYKYYHVIYRKNNFSNKGIPHDIASHIEQLKSIANESNKQYLLPNNLDQINKNKNQNKKRNKFIDKYSFSFDKSKLEQRKIKQKQKLTKILNSIKSSTMPITRGSIIESPSYFDMSVDNEAASKLSPDVRDVLSKFTENSSNSNSINIIESELIQNKNISLPSIPIPQIKFDEIYDKQLQQNTSNVNKQGINLDRLSNNISETNVFDNKNENEDELFEKEAQKFALQQHNDEIKSLKIDLIDKKEGNNNYNLLEQIQIKKRIRSNSDRKHFYIKNGKYSFSDIGVSDILCFRLNELGYKCPSIIQSLFIKQYHAVDDKKSFVIGSETGSGKTLAYLIPIIDDIIEEYINMNIIESESDNMRASINKDKYPFLNYPRAVIIQPTTELCNQVRGVIQSICRPFGIRVELWSEDHLPSPMPFLYDYLYSHYNDLDDNNNKIVKESSPEILVCTPSVLKHVFNVKFVLRLSYLIFDETDIMLTHQSGRGLWRHCEDILKSIQKFRKDQLLSGFNSNLYAFQSTTTIFTGATLANKRVKIFLGKHGIRSKSQKKTNLPDSLMKLFKKSIWIISPLQHRYSKNLIQKWFFIRDNLEKQEILLRSLHRHPAQKNRYKLQKQSFPPLDQTIIFCNSKHSVEDCCKFLSFNSIPHAAIHEGIAYNIRSNTLNSFSHEKKIPILVATDHIARGLDFGCNVEKIIQLDFASTPDIHYNRVGRTARAGFKGICINLYMSQNVNMVKQLINIINNQERIDKMFKYKIKNVLTKRNKKKLKKMGIKPPPTVKQQIDKMGIKPRKKQREFRFFYVQQKQKAVAANNNNNENENENKKYKQNKNKNNIKINNQSKFK